MLTDMASPATARWRSLGAAAVAGALVMALIPAIQAPASAAAGGALTGRVFEDVDRDGSFDPGEPGWGGKGVAIYNPDGSYADGAITSADGTWRVEGLPAGTYRAAMTSRSWREVRDAWVPTTTVEVFPEAEVEVAIGGETAFDLGWRRITWSTDPSAPLSTVEAPDGLVVESFNDAVDATEVLAALDAGSLRQAEAAATTVRFALGDMTYCATTVGGSPGSYGGFSATCSVAYAKWLNSRDNALFHEYGHAWSNYHRTIVNQWEDLGPYLEARGIDPGDERLYSSHAWTPSEMIAEDYRQLFGSPTAAAYPQENNEIPAAASVPGLAAWLSETFTAGTGDDGQPGGSDTTAPVLTGLAPHAGATVSGTFTASVSVGDDVTAAGDHIVDILLDGMVHAASYDAGSGLWTATIDSTVVPDGTQAIEARATDAAGNTASASHDVVVDNAPDSGGGDPEVTSVTSGSTASGGTWTAWVDVTVGADGGATAGVTVTASWTGAGKHGDSGTVSCVTDPGGSCRLSVSQPKRVPSVMLGITAPSAVTVEVAQP